MPGKVFTIMLIIHLIGVAIMAMVLNGMENRMIQQWGRGHTPDSVPAETTQDGR